MKLIEEKYRYLKPTIDYLTIEEQGRIVSDALNKLSGILAVADE